MNEYREIMRGSPGHERSPENLERHIETIEACFPPVRLTAREATRVLMRHPLLELPLERPDLEWVEPLMLVGVTLLAEGAAQAAALRDDLFPRGEDDERLPL